MSQFEQLKMLYKQLINISLEEDELVDKKAFEELEERLNYKNRLIEQVIILKKMVKFSPEEAAEFSTLETTYRENEEKNIEKFSKIRDDLATKLKSTNSDIKLKSAYSKVQKTNQGSLLDYSE